MSLPHVGPGASEPEWPCVPRVSGSREPQTLWDAPPPPPHSLLGWPRPVLLTSPPPAPMPFTGLDGGRVSSPLPLSLGRRAVHKASSPWQERVHGEIRKERRPLVAMEAGSSAISAAFPSGWALASGDAWTRLFSGLWLHFYLIFIRKLL